MKRLRSSRFSTRRWISCFWRRSESWVSTRASTTGEVERLRDVVVGPEPQRLDHVLGRVARRGHHHRQVGLRPALAQALQHVDSAETRHHHVEQHQVEVLLLDHGEGARAVFGHRDLEAAAAEAAREHVAIELVVVHHQQADAAGLDRLRRRAQGAGVAASGAATCGGGSSAGSRKTTGASAPPPGGKLASTSSSARRAAARTFCRSATYFSWPASLTSSSSSSA